MMTIIIMKVTMKMVMIMSRMMMMMPRFGVLK